MSQEEVLSQRKNKFLNIGRGKGFTNNPESLSALEDSKNSIYDFLKNKKSNELCIAHNNLRSQPVFMLISKLKLKSLENYLKNGERKIDIWYKKNGYEYIYFDKNSNFFENINTMEQLKEYNEK